MRDEILFSCIALYINKILQPGSLSVIHSCKSLQRPRCVSVSACRRFSTYGRRVPLRSTASLRGVSYLPVRQHGKNKMTAQTTRHLPRRLSVIFNLPFSPSALCLSTCLAASSPNIWLPVISQARKLRLGSSGIIMSGTKRIRNPVGMKQHTIHAV